MSVLSNGMLLDGLDTPTGYNLTNSLRFRSSATAYLNRTPASAGNRQKWTYSAWVKRGTLGVTQMLLSAGPAQPDTDGLVGLRFQSNDTLRIFMLESSTTKEISTTQVFRDISAWYHIVVTLDTTQATNSNRLKLYVNGLQVTSFDTANYPTQNYNFGVNNTQTHNIGRYFYDTVSNPNYFDGYLTEINLIDGQALTPSSFGENNATTGVWQPIRYTGTYGTNGYYLPFTDVATTSGSNAGLGKDFSGNGNYWNTNNISVTSGVTYDSMKDVPTLTDENTANYATLNPLIQNSYINLTNGNLTATSIGNYVALVGSSIALVGGQKYYFELTCQTGIASNFYQSIGIWGTHEFSAYGGSYTTYYSYSALDGTKYNGSSSSAYGATWTNGDVIGTAVDLVNGTITFYKNGVSQGTAFTGLSTSISYYVALYCYTTQGSMNFGQRPFAYTPPTGFKPLNSYNLPDSNIVAGNAYMDVTTYTGNATARSIVNSGAMSPDLVWIKNRSQAYSHRLFDTIRGAENRLFSDQTSAEGASVGSLTAFNSDGFSLGVDTAGPAGYGVNENNSAFVAWQWRASDSSAVSNTAGSITSTVSANPTAGFSIATFTAPASGNFTVGHGLGVAPAMFILKTRSAADGWYVYHKSLSTPASNYLVLNTTAGTASSTSVWGNTNPTSAVLTLGTNAGIAANATGVLYCWSEVAGFSKFGSYTGNGSQDGTFIYTGFRPKFFMIKRTDAARNWYIWDSSRNTYNLTALELDPNLSNAEATTTSGGIDIVSNGVKIRTNWSNYNESTATYVYVAFAENPFKNSLAR